MGSARSLSEGLTNTDGELMVTCEETTRDKACLDVLRFDGCHSHTPLKVLQQNLKGLKNPVVEISEAGF